MHIEQLISSWQRQVLKAILLCPQQSVQMAHGQSMVTCIAGVGTGMSHEKHRFAGLSMISPGRLGL